MGFWRVKAYLIEIARKLKESIALDKTVERLSRNLMSFDEETVLMIDDSDIAKSCSSKLEGLCKARDGSTGEITDGYSAMQSNMFEENGGIMLHDIPMRLINYLEKILDEQNN